jgi:hypothetical protein
VRKHTPSLYERSPRHLAVIWLIALITLVLIYWFELKAPAFHELLIPFYWITIGLTLVFTWRWQRSRTFRDRRTTERRSTGRRDADASEDQAEAGDRVEK